MFEDSPNNTMQFRVPPFFIPFTTGFFTVHVDWLGSCLGLCDVLSVRVKNFYDFSSAEYLEKYRTTHTALNFPFDLETATTAKYTSCMESLENVVVVVFLSSFE